MRLLKYAAITFSIYPFNEKQHFKLKSLRRKVELHNTESLSYFFSWIGKYLNIEAEEPVKVIEI